MVTKAKASKAKYVEPKWQYMKYITNRGCYSVLTRKGNKFYHVLWFGNGRPISVVKVPLHEGKYFYTLGPIEQGVQSWARYKRLVDWTKAASNLFAEAEQYVKEVTHA